jgi:hypothetical protein
MPPRPRSLSEQEVQQLRAELAAGAPQTVWFTSSAVGVPQGRSGKVMAFTEPAEGDFVQVRPGGSKDVLSFSPAELTLTRPARKSAAPAARGQAPATARAAAAPPPVTPSGPHAPTEPNATPGSSTPASSTPASSTPASSTPASSAEGDRGGAARSPQRATGGGRSQRGTEVTITLSGTADGEWVVDVVSGKKRTVRALAVTVSAVAQAAKALHPEVAEAIEAVLTAVREQQMAKVEHLRAELAEARRLLAELGEPSTELE